MSNDQTVYDTTPTPSKPHRWPWIVGIAAALFVGFGLGAAGQSEPEPVAAEPEVVTETVEVEVPGEIPAEDLEELAAREAALDELAAELDETAAELDEREAEVTETEQVAADSEFPGSGLYVVGEDVEPGEYRTEGPGALGICYYAWMTGTSSDADIITNEVTEGSARVTLNEGDVFDSEGCKLWKRAD